MWDARAADAERLVHDQVGRDLLSHVSLHELRTAAEVFVPIHDHTPEGGRGNLLNFIELERAEFIKFLGVFFMVSSSRPSSARELGVRVMDHPPYT